jgi:putative NADH-flavin reductase
MRIVVFGASGGCGRIFVERAAEAGHEVTAVVRAGTPYEAPQSVRVVRDDVLADGAIDRALEGQELVVSSIGVKRVVPANPWSKLASPPDLTERFAGKLAAAMHERGIKRVIAVSAAGVGDSAADLNWVMKFFISSSTVGLGYRDLENMERVYRASDLEWILVRPVTLTDGAEKPVREVPRFGATNTISRASVARWMFERVGDFEPFVHRAPLIAHA